MADLIRNLIESLRRAGGNLRLANQYRAERDDCDARGAAKARCENLEAYLRKFDTSPPRLIVLGEAAGYQGCRFSGIPFTSEFVLSNHSFFAGGQFKRSSCRERIWREPTASIVWELIAELDARDQPLMWATVPFHPHKPGNPLSNRTPTRVEAEAGMAYFKSLREIFPDARIVAAGKIAAANLTKAGLPHAPIRHPSHGGKAEFRAGVSAALAALNGRQK